MLMLTIEDASEELDQDVESIIEKGTNVDADDAVVEGEDDVVVMDAVADEGPKNSIVMPGKKTRKNTSYVWNYFKPNQENNCLALCSLCKATVS